MLCNKGFTSLLPRCLIYAKCTILPFICFPKKVRTLNQKYKYTTSVNNFPPPNLKSKSITNKVKNVYRKVTGGARERSDCKQRRLQCNNRGLNSILWLHSKRKANAKVAKMLPTTKTSEKL